MQRHLFYTSSRFNSSAGPSEEQLEKLREDETKRYSNAAYYVSRALPFYERVLRDMVIIPDFTLFFEDGRPAIAATNVIDTIYFNPLGTVHLTYKQIVFALCHEIGHIVYETRARSQGRDALLWNIATDYEINLVVEALQDPNRPEKLAEMIPGIMFDERFRNLSCEQIYDILKKEKEQKEPKGPGGPKGPKSPGEPKGPGNKSDSKDKGDKGQGGKGQGDKGQDKGDKGQGGKGQGDKGQGGKGQGGKGQGGKGQEGKGQGGKGQEGKGQGGKGQEGKGQGGKAGEGKGGHGTVNGQPAVDHGGNLDVHRFPPLTKEQAEKLKERVKEAYKAAENAKKNNRNKGQTPGDFGSLFEEKEPQVDWRDLFRRFAHELLGRERHIHDPQRPEKRYVVPIDDANMPEHGFIVPSRSVSKTPKVVVVLLDTSGSISDDAIGQAAAEIRLLKKYTKDIILIPCDTRITEEPITTNQIEAWLRSKAALGRGGSDFRPAFKWIDEQRVRPSLVVAFTDLEIDIPKQEPPYPIAWFIPPEFEESARNIPNLYGEIFVMQEPD